MYATDMCFDFCRRLLTSQQILENEPENEITIAIFRLLVLDLLQLFQVLNQGLINILGWGLRYYELHRSLANAICRPLLRNVQNGRRASNGNLQKLH